MPNHPVPQGYVRQEIGPVKNYSDERGNYWSEALTVLVHLRCGALVWDTPEFAAAHLNEHTMNAIGLG